MLFKQRILEGIADGTVTLAFRRWQRAGVKTGSRLHTPIGLVEIRSIAPLDDESDISGSEARMAGFGSVEELLREMNAYSDSPEGQVYRIEVLRIGDDPRIRLREQADLTELQFAELFRRLDRLDRASASGPWTASLLRLIRGRPGVRAAELAALIGWETEKLKLNTRKLKNLGLTISLGTGYTISPLGEAAISRMKPEGDGYIELHF